MKVFQTPASSGRLWFVNKIIKISFRKVSLVKKKVKIYKLNMRKGSSRKTSKPHQVNSRGKHYRPELWTLCLGLFSLLFGFFSATSAITIIGSVADWDPLAAAVMLCWVEIYTRIYYNYFRENPKLRLINSFKIGINFGIFVDAFKLTG
mmetsp:Transcript_45143/g.70762  ORF Transcript_45143/g.70762 Transcript_45143/m.70762 type:complete len:149 (+) Transcript_45143:185-631(+)